MSNWQYLAAGQPGAPVQGGGGGNPALSGYRSIQDARRAAAPVGGRTPQAEYPDGYLGNVNDRREDRLLTSIQSRLTQRNYQRGVHKGDAVDPRDYYWPDDVNPQAGIEAQSQAVMNEDGLFITPRWTQEGSTPAEQINHMGKNHLLSPKDFDQLANSVGVATPSNQINPVRSQSMSRLLPSWK